MELFTHPINREEAIAKEVLPGFIRKTLTYNADMTMVLFIVKAGTNHVLHHHHNSQIGYLLKGEMKFTTKTGEFILQPGDSYVFNRNEEHAAEFLKDSEFITVFSPARDEYTTKDLALPQR